MRYSSFLAELKGFSNLKKEWDLRNIRRLLSFLGNPEERLRIINITGTNGKGSVAVMLSSILSEAGYRVGTYTSPHMDDFRERFAVHGKRISKRDLLRIYSKMKPFFSQYNGLSLFEISTAIALAYFAERKVDFAVLEVGMGGRLDATNVGPQELLIITNVELDHTERLGGMFASIAREKAGLLRGKLLLTGETKPDALNEIRKACRRKNAKLILERGSLDYRMRLKGAHQKKNAALAARGAKLVLPKISASAICKGLSKAFIPGRLEVVSRNPLVVMDGAHNPAGAKALATALKLFPHKKLIVVYGAMWDKDVDGFLREIAPKADVVVLNQPRLERAMPLPELARIARKYAKDIKPIKGVKESVRFAKRAAGKRGLVLVTGSFYMVAEARGKDRMGISQ